MGLNMKYYFLGSIILLIDVKNIKDRSYVLSLKKIEECVFESRPKKRKFRHFECVFDFDLCKFDTFLNLYDQARAV